MIVNQKLGKSIRLFIVGILVCISNLMAQDMLLHTPISVGYRGQDIQVTAKVSGTQRRAMVMQVYFKTSQERNFNHRDMVYSGDSWIASIPGALVQGDRMEYFITALLDNSTVVTFPPSNPYNRPEEMEIKDRPPTTTTKSQSIKPTAQTSDVQTLQKKENSIAVPEQSLLKSVSQASSGLLLLSPEQNEILASEEMVLAVSLADGASTIAENSVQVILDGKDVTSQAEISDYLISLTPVNLKPGSHWIKVSAKDESGKALSPVMARFQVKGQETTPVKNAFFQGNVFADLRYEKMSNYQESFATTGGFLDGQYGVLRYEARALWTSLDDQFSQPRNRLSLSVGTKLIGVSAGDIYPKYNDLILWGKRVRGLSGYIRLGFFNIEAISGQTLRAIEGNGTLNSVFNPATGQNESIKTIARNGTFTQNLVGIRPSFGGGRNFQLGLSLLKVRDDAESIKFGRMPKDNVVFGPDLKIAFDKSRFVFQASGAFSLLTNDISPGAITQTDLDGIFEGGADIPINPADYADYFILNESTTPLDPTKMTSMAYHLNLKLSYFRNLIRIGYKSVGPEYLSLANNWLRNDLQGLYFSDRLRLFRNKVYFTLGYENYQDNFSQYNNNPKLNLKTLNYSISVYPGKGLPNIMFSMRDYERLNNLSDVQRDSIFYQGKLDTIFTIDRRENMLNRDLSVQIGYDVNFMNLNHSFNLSWLSADKIDKYKSTRLVSSYPQDFNSTIQMLSWAIGYSFPLRTTISWASNKNNTPGVGSTYQFSMIGVGADYRLLQDKLTTFAEFRRSTATTPIGPNATFEFTRTQWRLGAYYQLANKTFVNFDANLFSYSVPGGGNVSSGNDQIIRLRFEKYF